MCNRNSCFRFSSPTSRIGCRVPTSLFECMTETTVNVPNPAHSARRTAAGSRRPTPSTGSTVTHAPRRRRNSTGSAVAGCSTDERRMRQRAGSRGLSKNQRWADRQRNVGFGRSQAPFSARFDASDPPPVNTISSGFAPMSAATWARAVSTAAWACLP